MPELYKAYMGLDDYINIYGDILEIELNQLLSKDCHLNIPQYIYLEPLR